MQRPTVGTKQIAEFGRRVRVARLALGDRLGERVSQERLAELSGLHRTYVGHVERGEVNVALVNILRIAEALQVDPAVLVEGLPAPSSD